MSIEMLLSCLLRYAPLSGFLAAFAAFFVGWDQSRARRREQIIASKNKRIELLITTIGDVIRVARAWELGLNKEDAPYEMESQSYRAVAIAQALLISDDPTEKALIDALEKFKGSRSGNVKEESETLLNCTRSVVERIRKSKKVQF
ncbi:hypothetical protein GOZ78_02845 [Agrobacterium vitis]|uniref:Co-chaperone DjlA N-terminal domain-containing protein n=1 Tax=Agrobacterium vitis TaxID=373 RepID=A0ABD6GA53_AGRVI|nr:hypothetical protein [Agrobacterium vitis]MUO77834.1 hypothetical protein [Agrobacterium vitis]MUO93352.1 hypothetical protein [Agrobacterium vitis]MUP04703.1 hypothetical protein [Agrobacterium vitis]MUZ80860.1 hypothetical protein [Agrobacterium vitis]MVA08955.1 hypothetical protein [Agrobacterium vitis]